MAQALSGYLSQNGEVAEIELKAKDEAGSFLGQCRRAFTRTRAELESADFDLGAYDLICFGTPVWAFGPAPAMNTFLDRCLGIGGKEIVLFTTYGSGTGNNRCLNYMQGILTRKGAKSFQRFSIQQFKVKDKEFILSEINAAIHFSPSG